MKKLLSTEAKIKFVSSKLKNPLLKRLSSAIERINRGEYYTEEEFFNFHKQKPLKTHSSCKMRKTRRRKRKTRITNLHEN